MAKEERVLFTKEMKKDYTILIPNMLHMHFKVMVVQSVVLVLCLLVTHCLKEILLN